MAHRSATPVGSDENEYAYEDEQGEHWGARLLREMLEVAVLTLLLFVGVRLLVQNYQVDGPSMQPTLQNQEYILVDKASYYLHSPQRGDVIVFEYPNDTRVDYVKRIIGLPGDTVQILGDGEVFVDGTEIHEPYTSCVCNIYGPQVWHVPQGYYFVMGDHRDDSQDSRAFGPVARNLIIGKAALVYWPFKQVKMLSDYPSVYANVRP